MKRLVVSYNEIDSTNSQAKRLLAKGEIDCGAIITAECQTKGRGRNGREWLNSNGALLMSTVLSPDIPVQEIPLLNLCAAMAVKRVLKSTTGLELCVKWPNDIITKHGKKLCGILSEGVTIGGCCFAIIGIGLNTNATEFSTGLLQTATSVLIETGRCVDIDALPLLIAAAIDEEAEKLIADKAVFLNEYTKNCVTIGSRIEVHKQEKLMYGTATGVDPKGGLIVQTDECNCETVYAADVYIRKA